MFKDAIEVAEYFSKNKREDEYLSVIGDLPDTCITSTGIQWWLVMNNEYDSSSRILLLKDFDEACQVSYLIYSLDNTN